MKTVFHELYSGHIHGKTEPDEWALAVIKGQQVVSVGLGKTRHEAIRQARLEFSYLKRFKRI